MAPPSKRKKRDLAALAQINKKFDTICLESDEQLDENYDYNNNNDNNYDNIYQNNPKNYEIPASTGFCHVSTQTEPIQTEQSTSTEEPTLTHTESFVADKGVQTDLNSQNFETSIDIDLESIFSLANLLRERSKNWDTVSERIFSIIVYQVLRKFGVKFKIIREMMNQMRCSNIQSTHGWFLTIKENDDIIGILLDNIGGSQKKTFYENYPEIERKTKLFAMEKSAEKSSAFSALILKKYIDEIFQELNVSSKQPENSVRSQTSCQKDLKEWEIEWKDNGTRPYFEGHEREDNVAHRKRFCEYFLENEDYYYQQTDDDADGKSEWIDPINGLIRSYILICHDETTFKSLQTQRKRWLNENTAPFSGKGQGRSFMISGFFVQHKHEVFFELDEEEWAEAVIDYPELLVRNNVNYYNRSANAFIQPGKDNYFSSEVVLSQFRRLFIMLKYKKLFGNNKIQVMVDNATTHTAKQYDINLISKSEGKKCPYREIKWIEHNKTKILNCYNGETSKGLFLIAKELNLIPDDSISKDFSLLTLRELVSEIAAFDNRTKLEVLAEEFGVKIIYCPKYHCEFNPIEGVWCYMKNYVRKHTDQKFSTMIKLITTSMELFKKEKRSTKLWRRFWRAMKLYSTGYTYKQVMNILFGANTMGNIKHHRRILSYE
jgi:transposase